MSKQQPTPEGHLKVLRIDSTLLSLPETLGQAKKVCCSSTNALAYRVYDGSKKGVLLVFQPESDAAATNEEDEKISPPVKWRHDIQHNGIRHNDICHNDIKHNDNKHNDIKHNDTYHNDIKHNDIKHNDTYHNDILN